ncbi:Na+/H+ antiporter subunit B [Pontiella sulfatireligans]|uniref:Na(+)/H(+) antiporter subunit B n=1 Tax=Pontiella sulfatireligans TaxID=2750658 RepID=A0A6C2UQE4_9BACT|nr:Na+/H+ antiporter subunit B [Pontiella sulfatireligans]VGO22512.1 Na(+)/H(+) antiporter subunit B [Pontiella sulfatireligans]
MTSIILRTATRYMFPPLLVFSVYVLLRGHHYPGGGFVGGLFAGSAFALYALAFSAADARKLLRFDTRDITAFGLAVALISGIPPLFCGNAFLTGTWWKMPLLTGGVLDIGTPLVFDIGVYLVVLGVLLTLVFTLGEEE